MLKYVLIALLLFFPVTIFHLDSFEHYKRLPSSIERAGDDSCVSLVLPFIEQKSEYIEILNQVLRSPAKEYGLERIVDDPKLMAKFEKKIGKILKKKRSVRKVRKLVTELHLLSNSNEKFLDKILSLPITKKRFEALKEKRIIEYWEKELLANDLVTAMNRLGLIKNAEHLDRVHSLMGDVADTMKATLYLSFIFTPEVSFMGNKHLSRDALEQLFKAYQDSGYDFNAIKPELVKLWGNRTNVDAFFKSYRKVFALVMIPVGVYYTAEALYPVITEDLPIIIEHFPEIVDKIANYEIPKLRQKFGIYSIPEDQKGQMIDELLQSFREAYKAFRGKYPPDDYPKLVKKRDEYYAMDDFQLTLEYESAFGEKK